MPIKRAEWLLVDWEKVLGSHWYADAWHNQPFGLLVSRVSEVPLQGPQVAWCG